VKIILAATPPAQKNEKDQKRMMTGSRGKLLGAADGKLDGKDYDANVRPLRSGGSDTFTHQEAEGAYTFAVYDAMKVVMDLRS